VAFLVAEQKLSAMSEWEAERHAQVRLEAEQRRAEQRLEGARALVRMRDRGETVASIAQLGGCTEKLVRSYLKELRTSVPGSAADDGSGLQALGFDTGASNGDGSEALGGPERCDVGARAASPTVGGGVSTNNMPWRECCWGCGSVAGRWRSVPTPGRGSSRGSGYQSSTRRRPLLAAGLAA